MRIIGYRHVRLDQQNYMAHHLAWVFCYGSFPEPGSDVDHINGNRDDNRIENLRLATRSQNNANARIGKNNSSGYKGVTWFKRHGLWRAQITVNRVNKHLGYFKCPKEAHQAYISAAESAFGEFARAG